MNILGIMLCLFKFMNLKLPIAKYNFFTNNDDNV